MLALAMRGHRLSAFLVMEEFGSSHTSNRVFGASKCALPNPWNGSWNKLTESHNYKFMHGPGVREHAQRACIMSESDWRSGHSVYNKLRQNAGHSEQY